MTDVLRYAAFTDSPDGGNPAGVVLDARALGDDEMLAIAARVGYSETAFLLPGDAAGDPVGVRYFSPLAEVTFCGHATIAAAVAWADAGGRGLLRLRTASGPVDVEVRAAPDGPTATLTSVEPRVLELADADRAELLAALRFSEEDLDPALPPRIGYAGAFHPVLALADARTLAALEYDYPRLESLMAARGWTTVAIVHRLDPTTFEARNPFPPGGVVEDPATGAAAAALGAVLRDLGAIDPPARLTIHQGARIGRPSLLEVEVPAGASTGIRVGGRAVPIAG